MEMPSDRLWPGHKRTPEDDRLPGSEHPQCPYRPISGTAMDTIAYTFLQYPWSSDQNKQRHKHRFSTKINCFLAKFHSDLFTGDIYWLLRTKISSPSSTTVTLWLGIYNTIKNNRGKHYIYTYKVSDFCAVHSLHLYSILYPEDTQPQVDTSSPTSVAQWNLWVEAILYTWLMSIKAYLV